MTNDDELLAETQEVFHRMKSYDYEDCADFVISLATRIRELKDKLRHYEAYVTNVYDVDVSRVAAGTHVVVPVEPTAHMIGVGKAAFDMDLNTHNLVIVLYRAMIKAAQEGDNG